MSNANPDFSQRNALDNVDPLFVTRWSPRAFSSEPVPESDLAAMVDAARWSPSCYNDQPWCFYTSTEKSYDRFLDVLVELNQGWARSAPVLGFVVANKKFGHNGEDNLFAPFDTGAAWMAFCLQAATMGYHVHGMAGVHFDRVYPLLDLEPERSQVLCAFAVGRINKDASEKMTERKPLDAIWFSV